MQPLHQQIAVAFDYPVHFTRDVFAPENRAFRDALARREPARRHRFAVALDGGVAAAWPRLADDIARYARRHADALELLEAPLVVPGGEGCKNDPALPGALHAWIDRLGVDRQSFVVAIGGGAVLDLVGYAAATAHRGVRLVRLPTTVLAQDDSGVGVKNGVNAFGKKNFIGAFAPPFAVLNDARFLETLDPRDVVAGMSEAVKVALIRDARFFDWLCDHACALAAGDRDALAVLVRRSAELHLAHIAGSGDPFELGSARPLDFGHWAAHKLESLTGHRLRHGEAVAIGIALDATYAAEAGMLAADAHERVLWLLEQLGLPLRDDALDLAGADGRPRLLDGLAEFREHLGGELTVTLLEDVGRGVEVHAMDEGLVCRAIERLRLGAGVR